MKTSSSSSSNNSCRRRRRRRNLIGATTATAAAALSFSGGFRVVDAFVAPTSPLSSSAAVSGGRSSSSSGGGGASSGRTSPRRRTVPLVLRDPTEVDSLLSSDAAAAGGSHVGGPDITYGAELPLECSIDLVACAEEQRLNMEFTNDFILGDCGGGGGELLLDSAEDEDGLNGLNIDCYAPGGPAPDGSNVDVSSGAALLIESHDGGVPAPIRVEGIPPLEEVQDETVVVAATTATTTTTAAAAASATTSSSSYKIPTLTQIIKFALPATAIYLCDPLLSLIDTASVGLLAGTAHQAALSPAIAVVNYTGLLLAFLFVGATNFVAQAAARGATTSTPSSSSSSLVQSDGTEHQSSPARILLSTLQISLHTGTILGVALFALAPTLITVLSGRSTPLPPEVFQPAVAYVRIRALGFPAAAVLGSAQAACLGLKDTKTPLLVLAAAAVLNVLGDMSLVGCTSTKWLYGAAGAAWATTIGQFAAVALFLRLLKAKPRARVVGLPDDDTGTAASGSSSSGRLSLTRLFSRRTRRNTSDATSAAVESTSANVPTDAIRTDAEDDGSTSARGFLAEHNFQPHHIVRLPPKSTVKQFLPYVVPVTTTSVGRVSLFLSMAHIVSSCMGVVGMAAQTIALGIFDALCPLSQSLTLAAQAFVPGALEEQDRLRKEEVESVDNDDKKKNVDVLSAFSRQFLKAGAAFGLFTALLSVFTPFLSALMTTNAAVMAEIKTVTPLLAAIFAMHGLVMSAEGGLLGKEDVNFLGWMYGAFFFIMPACMMRIKHGALNLGKVAGLDSIWGVFMGYQFVRMLLWSGRAIMPTKDA
mmetsp:Transcript_33061/g.71555  ORF Transcript_33061/g.71555 Transcript_33061/m.71555 type:complete len:817 (+) Transcript_33061:196-2646(+)